MEKAYGIEIPQTLDEACDPRRLALIVYDMQVGVVRQIKNGREVTAKVVEVLGTARQAGIRVCFLRHRSLPKELMGVFQFRMAMAWQRASSVHDIKPWFLRDSPGFRLVPELAPRPSEAIFDKITMSAFEGTPLDSTLRDCHVNASGHRGRCHRDWNRAHRSACRRPWLHSDRCHRRLWPGHAEAGERALASLRYMGDAIFTDVAGFTAVLRRKTVQPEASV